MKGRTEMVRKTFATLLVLLLSGCTVGPNYMRPNVSTPETYRGASATPESIADVPWWELFRDNVLQELTREALKGSYNLRAAAARIEQARAQIGITRSFLYPQLDIRGNGQTQQVSLNSDPSQALSKDRTFSNVGLALNMAWELDVFGRIRRETEAASALYVATEMERRGVYIALVADVATNYFILRELDLELEIARRTLGLNDETVEFYRTRVDGGVSNQLELDQSVANRARTAQTIPDLQRQIGQQENLLNYLVGRNPGPIERGLVLTDQYAPPVVPPGMPAALLERRPDVLSAEQQLVAANANIGAAKALFFPDISLNSTVGALSKNINLVDKRAAIWSVAGGFFQPIFQGFRLLWNYRGTVARFDEALARYEQAAQNGFKEVADALVAIDKFKDVRAEQEAQVAALANSSRLARHRYEVGLSNYLDVLVADQQLFDAEILLARTRGLQLTAVVQLYRALGGGWNQPQNVQAAAQ
jgi:outer membrane protein, multidrug efflux system